MKAGRVIFQAALMPGSGEGRTHNMIDIVACKKCGTIFDTEVHEFLGPLEELCGNCIQEEICEECGEWESEECWDCPCHP